MAGHNKWSKVNRLKGALDVKRGKFFSRLSRETTVAASPGGGGTAVHPSLRTATARNEFMPANTKNRTATSGGRLLAVIPGAVAEGLTRDAYPFLITMSPDPLYSVAEALKTAGIEPESPNHVHSAEHDSRHRRANRRPSSQALRRARRPRRRDERPR